MNSKMFSLGMSVIVIYNIHISRLKYNKYFISESVRRVFGKFSSGGLLSYIAGQKENQNRRVKNHRKSII